MAGLRPIVARACAHSFLPHLIAQETGYMCKGSPSPGAHVKVGFPRECAGRKQLTWACRAHGSGCELLSQWLWIFCCPWERAQE